MYASIDTPVQYIKGVGPRLGNYLSRKGLRTIIDLLDYFPRAYEDRRQARDIRSLKDGEIVALKAKVVRVQTINIGVRRKIYDVSVSDASGIIHCKYFRIPFKGYFEKLQPGQIVNVVGKVILYRGRLEFHHPDIYEYKPDAESTQDALIPIYVETEGLTSRKLHKLITTAINNLEQSKVTVPETLPQWLRQKYNLVGRFDAYKKIHNPPKDAGSDFSNMTTQYHYRIKFEEFFWMELILSLKQKKYREQNALQIKPQTQLGDKLLAALPFALTNDQKKSIQEIILDLQNPYPMHRLLQGDVGCGKTLVAFMTAVAVIESSYQVAMMVPTEILAEQHYKQALRTLAPLGIEVALLKSDMSVADRRKTLDGLEKGKIQFVVGTQALIQDKVEFKKLAYVIIDEQHRFGVEQRLELKQKGVSPHFLLMTATPIPRSLALTVYGDLDVSIIREKPKDRIPIQTRVVFQNKRDQVLDFMISQLNKGRQAYFIYPLVEESEKIDLKNAVEEFEKLVNLYPDIKFGLLHGKMTSEEKDQVMSEFRAGKLQVLVSTTVIEVGVDVPNANIIIIENAERFGLSQLHQLRGRVGRGSHKSFCILIMGHAVSDESRERVMWLEKTSDGFELSEADLKIRGPGEFMGTRQSGALGFKLANIVTDIEILKAAREAAVELVKIDPQLERVEHRGIHEELEHNQRRLGLITTG